jgi:uncharacterized protein YrrD
MRLGKDLNDKLVISVTDGRLLGKVKDLYIDVTLNELTGINLGTEGMLRRKAILITRDDVVVFGVDAILVKHADVVTDDQTLDVAKEWSRMSKVKGREVHTPGGTRLGSIGDVLLDENGRVAGFALSKVFVEGPLAERGIILRETVIETGQVNGDMTIDLLKLEELYRGQDGGADDQIVIETDDIPVDDVSSGPSDSDAA